MRSLLFVPGDSGRKFAKALSTAADVLILDLEDAVAPSQKAVARQEVAKWLGSPEAATRNLFVRINPLDTDLTADDLEAVVRPGLAGIVLPKSNGRHDLEHIAAQLDTLEQARGLPGGSVRILVVATETPAAMFALGSYAPASPRLCGLTWGAEDLGAAIGVISNKDDGGGWSFPFQVARAQCLFAAANAGVAPIDTLFADFRDDAGLAEDCRIARRDGFTGRIAIHPAQVDTINRCFTPAADEVAHARMVVNAFAANPDSGTLGIEGKMYDIPHLKAAQKVLAAAGDSDE